MLSRGRNVTQCCSDSEAGKETSQARVKLHSVERIPGLLDGAERDCREALLQERLPSSSVVLKIWRNLFPVMRENRPITAFILSEVRMGHLCQCCMGNRDVLPAGPSCKGPYSSCSLFFLEASARHWWPWLGFISWVQCRLLTA